MKKHLYILLDKDKEIMMGATSMTVIENFIEGINPLHEANITIKQHDTKLDSIRCTWQCDGIAEPFEGYVTITDLHQ